MKSVLLAHYLHGLQILVLFTTDLFLSLAKTMTKKTAIPTEFLIKILIEIHNYVLSINADSS